MKSENEICGKKNISTEASVEGKRVRKRKFQLHLSGEESEIEGVTQEKVDSNVGTDSLV